MNDTRNYFMKYNHVWFLYFSSPVKSIMQYFCFARGEFVHIFKNSGFFSFFCDKMLWYKQPKGEMVYFSSQFREQTLMSGRWRQQVASHLRSWNIETKVYHLPHPIFSRVQTMKWSHSTLWWVFTHQLV